jgi:hypothetical protein
MSPAAVILALVGFLLVWLAAAGRVETPKKISAAENPMEKNEG